MRSTSAALLVFLVPSLASAGSALDKPAFTATPAELLAEAKKAPPSDSGAVILREDDDMSFDDKGLGVHRTRYVVVITAKDGVESWEEIWHEWRPWQQDMPQVRARVISSSGQVTELAHDRIAQEPNRVGALQHVHATLPGLAVGSVIEEEVTVADRAPFTGGRSFGVLLGGGDPTVSQHIVVSAPAALKIRLIERALPTGAKPHHTTAAGRETWSYDVEHLPRWDHEYQAPDDQYTFGSVSATAARSWSDVAQAYAAAVTPALSIAQPSELPHGETLEVARAVKAWLHAHVQYNGEELLDQPFDGVHLDAVVKRGSAGTNELGALLVALLRGAGIKADLVLVDRGPGNVSDPDRPWLASFEHVLVRAHIAGAEVWLDPENRNLRVGELRAQDHGRRALSIDGGALIHTPATTAAANVVHEVRTYQLADHGVARVTEVSREGGVFEAEARGWNRDSSPSEVRKQLEEYAHKVYRGDLESYTTSPPDNLDKPFEMTVNAQRVGRAETLWDKIEVWLNPSDALVHIDDVLEKPDAPVRKHDLALARPHIYEIENRLVIPEGFTLPAAQPDRTRNLGPLRLIEHQQIDGRTLVISFRLEADKARMTPAEVTETQHAIAELRNDTTHLVIDHTAWALVNAGDFKKALTEIDRLLVVSPKDAMTRARVAQMLLLVGDGEGARREARKSVELDPKNADTQLTLGWVLTYDLVGRRWAPGFDRAAAVTALTKAHALDPKHVGAAVELASVLERDTHGRRFEVGSDLHGAIEAWRAVADLDPTDDHYRNLAQVALWAGDYTTALAAARKESESKERNNLITACLALTEGADAAARDAPGDPTASLQGAAALTMLIRQYDVARKLLAEAGSQSTPGLPADAIKQLRRDDVPFRPTADPKDVVIELMLEQVDPLGRPMAVMWDKQVADDMRKEATKPGASHSDLVTVGWLYDFTRSTTAVQIDGDAGAWRAELSGYTGVKGIAYLASDGKFPRVIGDPEHLRGVGQHVLRLAGKNDAAAARLLDWVVKDVPRSHASSVWGPNLPRDTRAIELAGAVLAEDPDRSLTIATKCLVTTMQAQFVCDGLVAQAYIHKKRWADLETFAAGSWAGHATKSPAPGVSRATALMHLGRLEEARQVLDDLLAKYPDERHLLALRALLDVGEGHPEDAMPRVDAVAQRSDATALELNNIAWMKVVENIDIPGAVELAKRATKLDAKAPFIENTLAAAEAEAGDLHSALEHVRKAADLEGDAELSQADWYVVGRILEQTGRRDDAIAAYRRVTKKGDELFLRDTYAMAGDRLKALGAPRR